MRTGCVREATGNCFDLLSGSGGMPHSNVSGSQRRPVEWCIPAVKSIEATRTVHRELGLDAETRYFDLILDLWRDRFLKSHWCRPSRRERSERPVVRAD